MSSERADLQRRFIDRFSVAKFATADEATLADGEARLSVRFPESYRAFMKSYGGAHTPDLLTLIVARQLNHPDLHKIEPLNEMIEATEVYWAGGMPQNIVSFGSDCMGNAFCFERITNPRDDAPVQFFDHEFVEVPEVAASFDALLKSLRDAQ